MMYFTFLFFLLLLLAIVFGCAQILAGIAMLRLEMRVWSLIVSWVSFLPIHPACPLAIPISIWSLVTLSSRRVCEAYRYKSETGVLPVAMQSEQSAEVMKQALPKPAAIATHRTTHPARSTWICGLAILVTLIALILAFLAPGDSTSGAAVVIFVILLGATVAFLIPAMIIGPGSRWWSFPLAFAGFAVASMAIAETLFQTEFAVLELEGRLFIGLAGILLAILGTVELICRLWSDMRTGRYSSFSRMQRGMLELSRWILSALLISITVFIFYLWRLRGSGAEDVNVLLIPVMITLLGITTWLWSK